MRFGFIHSEKAWFPIAAMCRLLGVTRQGYYAYANSPPSARLVEDAALCEQVRQVFDESGQRYGSPRVLRDLQRRGVSVGKRRIERIMRSLGLTPPTPRRHKVTTTRDGAHPVAVNELARDFAASRPNERWVTDITYVWTNEGWAYLAVLLDLFSRSVVGWALDSTLSTRLPLAALHAAIRRRRPGKSLLHHSDRGCQYTSHEYRAELARLGITVSMSRKGNCWDNAVAESFFGTIKNELIHRRSWNSRIELRNAVFEYIEAFYNRRRLHSALAYKSPAEIEQEYAAAA